MKRIAVGLHCPSRRRLDPRGDRSPSSSAMRHRPRAGRVGTGLASARATA